MCCNYFSQPLCVLRLFIINLWAQFLPSFFFALAFALIYFIEP